MKNILHEFARRVLSDDKGTINTKSPYDCTIDDLGAMEEKLMSSLEDDLKITFRKFVVTQAQAELKTGIDRFIQGYRLGVLLTMEVMNNKDKLFSDGEDC